MKEVQYLRDTILEVAYYKHTFLVTALHRIICKGQELVLQESGAIAKYGTQQTQLCACPHSRAICRPISFVSIVLGIDDALNNNNEKSDKTITSHHYFVLKAESRE